MVKKEKTNYWKIAGVILLILLVWNWIDTNEDYEDCIDTCMFYMSDCFYTYRVYDETSNSFISPERSSICLTNLQNCVEECKN